MNRRDIFAVSSLMESISREDFAIHLYSRQHLRDPFANVPFAPLYYVLNEGYFITPSPVILGDLLGVVEVEVEHKRLFTEMVQSLNPNNEPVPKITFPEDLFESVQKPEVEPIRGMNTTLRIIVTNIVQEQRARLIYEYFSRETGGTVSDLFAKIAQQEIAHRKIFERALKDVTGSKKITMFCPVCGKLLNVEPKEGANSGCAFCMSRFTVGIENDDFVLRLRGDSESKP